MPKKKFKLSKKPISKEDWQKWPTFLTDFIDNFVNAFDTVKDKDHLEETDMFIKGIKKGMWECWVW